MKKKISHKIIITLIIITSSLILSAESNTDLASRYLKLSMTYMLNGNISEAGNFIKKAENILDKANQNDWNSKYWQSVAYEYRGYMNLYLGMKDIAMQNFDKAKTSYKKLLSMKGGSQDALKLIDESLKTLDKIVFANDIFTGIKNLKIMNLDNQKIKDNFSIIPGGIENLSLSNNRIKNIYGLIEKTNLTHLNLSDNRIKELPINIDKLSKLEWLDLSNNRIKDLPASICNLKNLKVLNLKNNRLPIEDITNLIKCLPNTNILYDEYILKDDENSDEIDDEFDF